MTTHRLLIVEDDGAQRRALRGTFARMGWAVDESATLSEATRMLAAHPEPCCIILDLMLPDGRGESLLRHVRSQDWKTRVVVTTAIISVIRLQGLEPLKPDDVLMKPLTAEAVCQAVSRACDLNEKHQPTRGGEPAVG